VTRLGAALYAWILILAAQPASATILFDGDWSLFAAQFQNVDKTDPQFVDGQPVGWLKVRRANHWGMVQEMGIDRLQVENDPTSPKGGAVLRVEVKPGDFIGHSGERAEVTDMRGPNGERTAISPASGHEVYGISIKLDPNWQPPRHDKTHGGAIWGVFLQLHSPNLLNSPPPFAFAAEDNFHLQVTAGDRRGPDGKLKPADIVPLTVGDLRLGHWVEFLIDVVWAYDDRGSLTIYRRDEGESRFIQVVSRPGQPTLQFDSQVPDSQKIPVTESDISNAHYWRLGYYRSISPGITSRLWLGPFVRGTSLEEVAVAAFGKY